MLGWLGRLFPETIFSRRLPAAAERRLRLARARAEESLVTAHVHNALLFVEAMAEDATYDRAIEMYIREMAIPEPLASTVATRTLVKLGESLDPAVREAPPLLPAEAIDAPPEPAAESDEPAPVLRLAPKRGAAGA